MSNLVFNTLIGDVKLEKRYDCDSGCEFYDVYVVASHPYKENDQYLGELWSHNEGVALERDVNIFLFEKGL